MRASGVLLALLFGVTVFVPPTPEKRREALGSLDGLPPALRAALSDESAFAPIPVPAPDDWLASHPEPGQTFRDFALGNPNRPGGARRKLYLLPIGAFPRKDAPSLDALRRFAEVYFQLETVLLSEVEVAELHARSRQRLFGPQLRSTDLLAALAKRLPPDAYAFLGVTMTDLYPDDEWNFVFGQASLRERVGVYSFARYAYGTKDPHVVLARACKVLAHETGHMFGIEHCVWWRCLMNGSNHLAELDARPMHLCPVDLRKLHWSVRFDVGKRDRELRDFCRAAGLAPTS